MGYTKLEREADIIYVIWYFREPYHYEGNGRILERIICFSKEEYEKQLEAINKLDCFHFQCTRVYKLNKEEL